MNVLHIISSLDSRSGGTSEACAGLAVAQAEAGISVSVMATERESETPDVKQRLQVQLGPEKLDLIGPARGPLASHPNLRSGIERAISRADVIHVHGVWEDIQFLAACEAVNRNKPWIWSPHGMLDPWSLSQRRLKKRLYWWTRWRRIIASVAAVHAITRSEARFARPMFPDTMREIVEPLGTKGPCGMPPDPGSHQVLFLSRLHPKKNVECLIQACAKIERSAWSLSLVGDGANDYRSLLKALSKKWRIEDRVHFAGDLRGTAKADAFRSSAVFCLPSLQENFGIVVIEALAAGLPVLISPSVGLAEDLADLEPVRVIDGGPTVWAQEIDAVLADVQLRQTAAEAGPEIVRERFSWTAIGERWVKHYRSLFADWY